MHSTARSSYCAVVILQSSPLCLIIPSIWSTLAIFCNIVCSVVCKDEFVLDLRDFPVVCAKKCFMFLLCAAVIYVLVSFRELFYEAAK